MAFNIPGRQPSIAPQFNPLGSSGNNSTALGTPFGGQSGGVQAPSSFQQQSGGGGGIFSVADRNAAGFGPQPGAPTGVAGRTLPNGQWVPFSPPPPQQQATPPVQPADGPQHPIPDGGAPGIINTSINPTGVFTPDQTQIAVNQAVADSGDSLDFSMKPFIRPGASRSNSTVGAALPAFSNGLLNAASAQANIPLFDRLTNLNHQRQGEVAREEEFFGLAGIGATLQEQDQFARLALLQPALSLADRLLA